jgi:hypothetical protein
MRDDLRARAYRVTRSNWKSLAELELAITEELRAAVEVERANTVELLSALERLVADILDYEQINNLSPSPGKQDCWQSVTRAKAAIRARKP